MKTNVNNMGINKVIRTLIACDFLLQSGWGLIGPIFAIFLISQIQYGSLPMVGLVVATYWIVKSLAQPFIAQYLDLKKGEYDDFQFLMVGLIIANLVPLGYVFATKISHIFLLEFIRALAMACVIPSWAAMFTRHIDKGWEAFSWSIDSTMIGLAMGFSAAFGGIFVTIIGFQTVFALVSIMGLGSALSLLFIRKQISNKDRAATAQALKVEKTI